MTKRPGRGSKAEKERKRRIVAKGIAAGKSTRAIAKAAGTGKRHVERLAAEPETKIIVTELMKPHRGRLVAIVDRALGAVEDGLTHINPIIRLRAVGRAKQLLELAEGPKPDAPGVFPGAKFAGTMEELLVLYRKVTAENHGAGTGAA